MKLIDPIDIKQSIKDGQLEAFAARGKVYIKDVKSGDCVKILEEQPSAEPNLQPTCNQLATDCISRKEAIDAIDCDIVITGRKNAELVAETIAMFADRIKSLPSAESVIRCKDCKYWWSEHKLCKRNKDQNYNCACMKCGSDFYCANAERRTDERLN